MRDIEFYEKREDYEESIISNFLPIIYENDFYRNLIHLTIDHYTPIFYRISHPSEHFGFSGAYHWETRRERYPNKARENLFWLHDFTHMLFPYPYDVFHVSEAEFLRQFTYQERISSTETEVFAYYRVPGLRELVFPDEKLYYDVLLEEGWAYNGEIRDGRVKPDAVEFLEHRNRLVLDDEYGDVMLGRYPEILAFFQQWRRLTPKWVGERYADVVKLRRRLPEYDWLRLSVNTYESYIRRYHYKRNAHDRSQSRYQENVMRNVLVAYAIMGWDDPPTRWRHMGHAIDRLEGAVFFQ